MARHMTWLIPTFLMFAGWAAWAGCSAGGEGSGFGGDGGQAAAGATSAGGGGAGGTGGESLFDAGDNDGSLQDGDICEAEELDGERTELDIFMVIDISGSMGGPTSGDWPPTRDALIGPNGFFNDPLSDGINIGLNFFPPNSDSSCNQALYNPIQHPNPIPPLFKIPQDNATLSSILTPIDPYGSTPMAEALDGTYAVAGAWASTYPDHKVIVVLTGDGEPNVCGTITDCANYAGAAYTGMGIETYCIVISSGAMSAMTSIAAQGGTGTPYDVSGNVSQFAQVMSDIRSTALGCEFVIPEPEEEEFDVNKVNVKYYPGGNPPAEELPQADDLADCGGGPGWYFDNPANPTKIILCPDSCDSVENDPEAKVSIAFGCPTQAN